MIEEIRRNPSSLSKYDKDKEQLKYEKEIVELLKNKHSLIKYIHPAIILRKSEEIINIVGDSFSYLEYIPKSVIDRYQDIIYANSKSNPKLLKYINSRYQLKYKDEVLELVRINKYNYDYLDVKLKKDNFELFKYCINELYKVSDEYLVEFFYKLSLKEGYLLNNLDEVLLDKELILLLGDSLYNIIYCKDIMNSLKKLYLNKYRYGIFKKLLRLYSNNDYIEKYINRLINLVNVEYYFYKENNNIISLNKDLYYVLYKDSLSINEIKCLYYILSNNLLRINSKKEFYKYNELRDKYLDSVKLESIRDYKNIIFEYKYAMNYEEVGYLISKYANNFDYLLSKYKKYKYNIEEIDEYETLLILDNMINLYYGYNDIDDLEEVLEEERANHKIIKSYDIRIYLEDRLKDIYHKELSNIWNKKLKYFKERKVLYEELISRNKQVKSYIGNYIEIKEIDVDSTFNILIGNIEDSNNYEKFYSNVGYDYLDINNNEYYRYSGINSNNIISLDKYKIDSNYGNVSIEGDIKKAAILIFDDKLNNYVIRESIENNIPIEILNVSKVKNNSNKLINNLYNKILHYIDNNIDYEEVNRISNYTPLECIPLLFSIYNNMYMSTKDRIFSKERITKIIMDILNKANNIKDNDSLTKQVIKNISSNLGILNGYYDKREVCRLLDKMNRKYNLYSKSDEYHDDVIFLLNDNLEYIKLNKKYNKNQIEYRNVVKKIDFNYISENIKILEDNFYNRDIYSVIRRSIYSNILANILNIDYKLAVLGSIFGEIGKIDNYRSGDYSSSIFRSIYKNILNKEDINMICAAIDIQDSQDELGKIKEKYKIKNMDNMLLLADIIRDSNCLDNYRFKRELIDKKSSRLIKIKDLISRAIYEFRLSELLDKKIISSSDYNNYLINYVEIDDIWKKH